MFISLSTFSSLDAGRIICVQQRFIFQLIKLKARATVPAEWAKRKVGGTSKRQKSGLGNSNSALQGLDTCQQEQNKGILPRVREHKGVGHDSCGGPANGGASVTEPEGEIKLEEESSDEDEAAFLRKLEAEAMKNYCVNGTSNEVQELSHDSDIDVAEQKMKQTKRKMRAESVTEDYEGNHNKRVKTAVQSEVVKELKGVDCGQAAGLSLSAGFVWDADPSLLPAAAQKSDSSSDEEEVSKVGT
jgi:hypothetical protein